MNSKTNLIFIGGGGHFKVAYNIACLKGCFNVVGVYDDRDLTGQLPPGITYLGDLNVLQDSLPSALAFPQMSVFFCSIGDNQIRHNIVNDLKTMDLRWCNLIHPTVVEPYNFKIGEGVLVCAGAQIEPDVKIGDFCIINTNSSLNHDSVIGSYTHIAPGSTLCGHVSIGMLTLIGAGTVVKPRTRIGDQCVVGCGSNVVSDIPNNARAWGNPCRIKERDQGKGSRKGIKESD